MLAIDRQFYGSPVHTHAIHITSDRIFHASQFIYRKQKLIKQQERCHCCVYSFLPQQKKYHINAVTFTCLFPLATNYIQNKNNRSSALYANVTINTAAAECYCDVLFRINICDNNACTTQIHGKYSIRR